MNNKLKKSENETHRLIGDIIEDIRIAMVTTINQGGGLSARPLFVQEIDENGSLWFFISKTGHLDREIQENERVNVTFAASTKNRFLSATAVATEINERAKMKELWNPLLNAWFKGGLESPDIALLKLDLYDVEYWDSPSSPVVKIGEFFKALAGGEKPFRPGKHENVDLRH